MLSFCICQQIFYLNNYSKLGTLNNLFPEHGPTRDDVMSWARNEAKFTIASCVNTYVTGNTNTICLANEMTTIAVPPTLTTA